MNDALTAIGGRTDELLAWLGDAGCTLAQPVVVDSLPGGRSNLSIRIRSADAVEVVVRRPPLGPLLPSAHDVVREARIMRQLAGTNVPVPAILAMNEDPALIGAPFFVMAFVEGLVLRGVSDAATLGTAERGVCARSLVDVLARIHAVDVDAVGLGELARRSGYLPRQLARWSKQWALSSNRASPRVAWVAEALAQSMPPERDAVLVHGDYRFDNVLLTPAHAIGAVLDWELSTLGDPLADLGLLLAYWTEDENAIGPLDSPPTAAPGFPSRDDIVQMYAAESGRDVSALGWYVAFAFWKLAVIMEGVRTRHADAAYGASTLDLADLALASRRARATGARPPGGRLRVTPGPTAVGRERLDGRVCLVTGASRGIGAATARGLGARGGSVVLVARDAAAIDAIRTDLERDGGDALAIPTDLMDASAIDRMIERVAERFAKIDVLVNNAAVLPPAKRVERITRGQWDAVLTMNLTVPWALACAAKQRMPAAGGVVINVASTAAFYPSVGLAPYNVSKAALVMLTRVCALEWARDNVRVIALAPGKADTELAQPILQYFTDRNLPVNPLGRLGTVEEIADLIAYLVSDQAAYMTGTVVTIDGGELLASAQDLDA